VWLPWSVDFAGYVAAASSSDDDIDKQVADPQQRQSLHRARVVRDYCVGLVDQSLSIEDFAADLKMTQADIAEGHTVDRLAARLESKRRKK
jgi:hypothetical protein